MIKYRANRQFLAMRGERLAGLAPNLDGAPASALRSATTGAGAVKSLPPSTAGQEAAPCHPNTPDGAASTTIVGVDLASGLGMSVVHAVQAHGHPDEVTGVYARLSPRVAMLFSLICAQQGVPPR